MGTGYSKLDCGIVDSSLWEQPHDVVRVWIAMLAKTDANGYVRVAPSAMARLCMVDRERFNEIIEILTSPDADSRSPEHDGRRLECVDGGWQILNYLKYREGLKQPDRTNAERQKRHRETKTVTAKPLRAVTRRYSNAYAEAKADADADVDAKALTTSPPTPPRVEKVDHLDGFDQFWQAYPRKMNKPDAQKAYKQVKAAQHLPDILNSLEKHKAWTGWTKDGGQFIPYPASWLRATGWENEMEITGLARLGMAVGSDTSWD